MRQFLDDGLAGSKRFHPIQRQACVCSDTLRRQVLRFGRQAADRLSRVKPLRRRLNTTKPPECSLEPGGYAIYWPYLDDGIEVCHLLNPQPMA